MVKKKKIGGLKNKRMPKWKSDFAKAMRKNPTEAERVFWGAVRKSGGVSPLGVRVHRQKLIYGYIADFWIPAWRIIVEIDGSVHRDQKAQDAYRDSAISSLGIKTMRFTNDEVLTDIENVLARIKSSALTPPMFNKTVVPYAHDANDQ